MKLNHIVCGMLGMLLIASSCRKKDDVASENDISHESITTSINFIVKDQSTDFGVSNATITVKSPSGKVSTLKVGDNGKVSFAASSGKYDFIISADGYKPIETFFVGGKESVIEANINLDPISAISTATVFQVKDKVILTGYVKDADENTPLAGAQINAGGATGTTNSRGYFSIELAAPPFAERAEPQTVSIKVSKEGYWDYTIKNFYLIPDTYILKISLTSLVSKKQQEKLKPGEVKTAQPQEVIEKHGMFDRTAADEIERYRDMPSSSSAPKSQPGRISAVPVPSTIRVGTSCSCHSCSNVQVMSLEAYTQSGLDEEWISSWGAASLQAGAVAYRSYGAWWVANPISSNYDIANTTCAQVWASDIVTSTKNAAIATAGQILVRNNAIFKSEYSSENNNSGCGNGYSGTGGTYPSGWPCISDSRCAGRAKFGHGRGMCQYGSSFWASDKTAAWILDHYYTPGGVTVQGSTPPPSGVFDAFTSNVGRFNTAPTYSGSTVGIATTSTATWDSGSASLKVTLNDNTGVTTPWFVRLLSGTGTPANNVLSPKTGTLYFSMKTSTAQAGATVRIWVDDSDGTEQSPAIAVINDGLWHTYSWSLSSFGGTGVTGNGVIDAANVTLDAIILQQGNTATQWVSYIDNVGN